MGVLDLKEISKSAREIKDGLKKGISNDVNSYKRYQENKTDKRTLKQKFLDLVHKCFVKAIRAKKLGAPLGFILSCVCLLAVLACIYTIIFFKHMPPGAISYLIVFVPLSLVGSYYSIGLLMSEVSELKWYCDNCSSSMDETY